MSKIMPIGTRRVRGAARRIKIGHKPCTGFIETDHRFIVGYRKTVSHGRSPIDSHPAAILRRKRCQTQFVYIKAERVFGLTLTNSAGRDIPVRWIGEQHIREDCQGRIPSMADWLRRIQPEPWMANGHIEQYVGGKPCGDPRAAWVSEVAAGRTVLGLKDWMTARATQATQGA